MTKVKLVLNEDNFVLGRRGPSLHLSYQVPTDATIEWYYNEVTVPKTNCRFYYMANGFTKVILVFS
jgi:hypothetical protein